jgi:hypothetical protein
VLVRQLQCSRESRRAATNDQNRVIPCAHDIKRPSPLESARPQ